MQEWTRIVLIGAAMGAGCAQPPVGLVGVVYGSHLPTSSPLAGVDVTAAGPASGRVLDRAETDASGRFALVVPAGSGVALEVRGAGLVTAVFHGNAPVAGELAIEDRALFGVSVAELAAERERFAGCPGADEAGAVVFGEMRLFDLVDADTGDSPLAVNGRVDVTAVDGQGAVRATWPGCYLDDAGTAYDATAEFTGPAGRFAVFAVEPGFHEVTARNQVAPNEWLVEPYPAWVPERDAEDVVVPMWPVWVEAF